MPILVTRKGIFRSFTHVASLVKLLSAFVRDVTRLFIRLTLSFHSLPQPCALVSALDLHRGKSLSVAASSLASLVHVFTSMLAATSIAGPLSHRRISHVSKDEMILIVTKSI